MDHSQSLVLENRPGRDFAAGAAQMVPLCLPVLPWGVLAGSMAVQAGLTTAQSVGMSALVFAGAAQLVSLGMAMAGSGALAIALTVFFITAQHFLYGLSMRGRVSAWPARLRLPLGFLLTDELFALSCAKGGGQSPAYLLGAGWMFYLSWLLSSIAGIAMANTVPDLGRLHLDFSIIATFVAIVVPMVKRRSALCGALFSLLAAMLLGWLGVEGGIVIAGVAGMLVAVLVARLGGEKA
ncbi:branched-chain amino acid ABC transporter permease [Chromobacterium vaccinii]|uniref:AzlC family ABC transporter permease n=1 Tax=Chromobacterium vaccinii TaxID=1108595 RepID=UPI000CE94580|nr:AzlC family ABC transporter permease [Chromobacterium vaccinii]AVG14816.1 branched-chain amino acid ABC transporter permease [Chromobacterium vaccinii]